MRLLFGCDITSMPGCVSRIIVLALILIEEVIIVNVKIWICWWVIAIVFVKVLVKFEI